MVSAWVTLYMGIYMAHESLTYQSSYAYWLAPCISVMGALVLTDICLTAYTIFWATDEDMAISVPPVEIVIAEDTDPKLTRIESLERIHLEKSAAVFNAYLTANASDAGGLRPRSSVEQQLSPQPSLEGQLAPQGSLNRRTSFSRVSLTELRRNSSLDRRNSLNMSRISTDGRE